VKTIYTDGSDKGWAFIIVENNKIIHSQSGAYGLAVTTDNDHTESEAIFQAAGWAEKHPDNYTLVTDSKSSLNKIKGTWKDHTGNKRWKGIQNIIAFFNTSREPVSFNVQWKKRCSDQWMKAVDKLSSP
jgi:ribonuclease HI